MTKQPHQETKLQQKKRFNKQHQRLFLKKLARLRQLQQTNIIFQIVHTIHEYFPDLFARLRDIEDGPPKSV